jgi:selenocysteine lyase/cysteine desulfurase
VLYGKRERLKDLKPYKVRPASNDLPDAWETGTQNHECMAGVMAAVEYIADIGRHSAGEKSGRREALRAAYEEIHRYERHLTGKLIAGLLMIPGVTVYGITDPKQFDHRVGTVSIRMKGHTPAEIATRLGDKGLFTWDGNFYALDLTEQLGIEDEGGLLRIGVLHYNTTEEIDRLLAELRTM